MHTLDSVNAASLRDDVPEFRAGDSLKVHVKVVEGSRSACPGLCWHRDSSSRRRNQRNLHRSQGQLRLWCGTDIPVHSPIIEKIELVSRGDVRRAKLYYLRDLRGKAAKIWGKARQRQVVRFAGDLPAKLCA